ncbi:MAG: DUF5011 domain-containing protein [Firmicutes bacterium]|nr:DUF5011 domain-containing protein [Bacillota bacterium]
MKKLGVFVLSILIILFSFKSEVCAQTLNYLPGGDNYLTVDLFEFDGPFYSTDGTFLIKPYTDYIMTVSQTYFNQLVNEDVLFEILYYDDEMLLESSAVLAGDFSFVGNENTMSYLFKTPTNTNYAFLSFYNINDYFMSSGFDEVILEEGSSFDGFESYSEGTIMDTEAPCFEIFGIVLSYVHSPITSLEILSALQAYDDIDGDVSNRIVIISDDYEINKSVLGTYVITFEVSDLSGNSTQIDISVEVVDILKPVFSDIETIEVAFPNSLTISEIVSLIHASDNYDGDITTNIVLTEDNYSSSNFEIGNYNLIFQVSDSSGNTEYYTVFIDVIDNEFPIFSGITSIIVGYDTRLYLEDILQGLSISDNYDNSEDLEIVLISENYFSNYQLLGNYQMVFKVEDSSGNITEQIVSITVVDEIGPAVYFDFSVIQVYSDTILELSDLTNLFIQSKELNALLNYEVVIQYDSYTAHASTPGMYQLSLDYKSDDGLIFSKTVQVLVKDRSSDYYYEAPIATNPPEIGFWEENKAAITGIALSFIAICSNLVWFLIYKKK